MHLYKTISLRRTEPYYENPLPGVVYCELDLEYKSDSWAQIGAVLVQFAEQVVRGCGNGITMNQTHPITAAFLQAAEPSLVGVEVIRIQDHQ
jgi:hypothetical protein